MKKLNIIAVIAVLMFFSVEILSAQEVKQNMIKFGQLLRLVDSRYTDTVDIARLTEDAIVDVLSSLDPHSVYISKEDVAAMNEPLQGGFFGIGISFNIFHDTLMVLTTISGGPSEKVGLRPNDRIMYVDGELIAGKGITNQDVYKYLKGPKGTIVELKVKRRGESELLDFTIVRDKIPINSLDASYMLKKDVGYIKINRFSATTFDEFMTALRELKSHSGFKDLVLDLRGNGGGYLNAAYELADQFLDGVKLIVYTEGLKSRRREYNSSRKGEMEDGRVMVLIDENSASAAEILSGAIQDWDRGVVVGRRSYGKGLVQQQYPLNDGSMVRLTTAHYYTPSGRCIQRPYKDGIAEYRRESLKRYEDGELFSEDSVHLDTMQIYKTRLNNRTVYGGGGIMPDIFVPMDTSKYYRYYNRLMHKNLIYDEALTLTDQAREQLKKKYPNFKKFKANYKVPEEVINEIIEKGEAAGIKKDEASLEFICPKMKRQIKALVARNLYSISCYFEVVNEGDKTIDKAVEILDNAAIYNKLLIENN